MVKDQIGQDEAVIGKRLQVQSSGQSNSDRKEGKINAYDKETGKHELLYDDGTILQINLEGLGYEWKKEERKKAVVKVDLETGQVLESFLSIVDAAASAPGSGNTNIIAMCSG